MSFINFVKNTVGAGVAKASTPQGPVGNPLNEAKGVVTTPKDVFEADARTVSEAQKRIAQTLDKAKAAIGLAAQLVGQLVSNMSASDIARATQGAPVDTAEAADTVDTAEVDDTADTAKAAEVSPAFRQTEFASTYQSRLNQTPAASNSKVQFEGERGESLCVLKPPPDEKLSSLLDEAGAPGIYYKNAVPDFLPLAKAQVEIPNMQGGTGTAGTRARAQNFAQAEQALAKILNESPELAQSFGMEAGNIKAKDIEAYRKQNKLTWHEVNDTKHMQLVPTEINGSFGHLGGVGEINAGAYLPGGFASK